MAWFKCAGGGYTDYSNTTVTASAVSQDSNYTYLTIPNEGIYNTSSKVRTLNSNLSSTTLVWTNSGNTMANGASIPSSALKNYDSLIVYGEARTDYLAGGSYAFIDISKPNNGLIAFQYSSGGGGSRYFSVDSNKNLTFGDGCFNYSAAINFGVPLKIWGVKGAKVL